jgi:hypothetical protein
MAIFLETQMGETACLGKSKAIVIDNKDPDGMGRIRVDSPVFGKTAFINYLTPTDGFYAPPNIGSVVYVEAGGGDQDYPLATSLVHCGTKSNSDVPPRFRRSVPTIRGWVTPGKLDTTGNVITRNSGQSIELDDGYATVDSSGKVTHTTKGKGIRLITSTGHTVELIEDIDNKNSHIRIRNKSNSIHIDLDLTKDIIEIDAAQVKIGTKALQSIVRGDAFKSYFDSHTHSAGSLVDSHTSSCGGITGPPVTSMTPPCLSTLHKVE